MKKKIEIYIENSNKSQVVDWITYKFDDLKFAASSKDDMDIYYAVCDGKSVQISIIKTVLGDVPRIGIWVKSKEARLQTSIEFGRDAYKVFGKSILCDPGELSTSESEFVRIDHAGEHITFIEV